jgi:homoserine dehydrogenase
MGSAVGIVRLFLYNAGMRQINVILLGYGNVGRAFARLVRGKSDYLRVRYSMKLIPAAIFRSRTSCRPDPADWSGIDDWKQKSDLAAVLEQHSPGVLVDCTPSLRNTGEPGLTYLRTALDKGWHAVTANKSPLVYGLSTLREAAEKNGVRLKISGATAAALPAADMILRSLAGTEISKIEGVLNGTSNYILTRMGEGLNFDDALAEAQAKGIAEPDPAQDIEGWDTAYKMLILANAFFQTSLRLDDVFVKGLDARIEEDPAFNEDREGYKLLGRCEKEEGSIRIEVRPARLEKDHPLYFIRGTEKGILFITDTMGKVVVSGGKSDPTGAAAALLKDIIGIYDRNPF